MIAADRDALVCDLAETYGILDYKALPVGLLAALSSGLRENSRIRLRLAGQAQDTGLLLLAAAVDRLSWLAWAQTEGARQGKDRPPSLLAALLGTEEGATTDGTAGPLAFDTAAEYEAARAKIVKGGYHGN